MNPNVLHDPEQARLNFLQDRMLFECCMRDNASLQDCLDAANSLPERIPVGPEPPYYKTIAPIEDLQLRSTVRQNAAFVINEAYKQLCRLPSKRIYDIKFFLPLTKLFEFRAQLQALDNFRIWTCNVDEICKEIFDDLTFKKHLRRVTRYVEPVSADLGYDLKLRIVLLTRDENYLLRYPQRRGVLVFPDHFIGKRDEPQPCESGKEFCFGTKCVRCLDFEQRQGMGTLAHLLPY